MRLLPNTLMGRTALLMALLIILSQVAWFGILRIFFIPPLRAAHANPIVSAIVMARTALEALPEDQRTAFLAALGPHSSFRIVADGTPPSLFQSTQEKPPADLAASLRQTFGPAVAFKTEPRTHDLWIRFPVRSQMYWLILPRNRVRPLFPLDLLIWIVLGAVIALVGAWLVIFRLNRQLRRVLDAARRLGHGETPANLPETGPEEIRDLSRGFNQMTEGLQKLDAERRLMLAGISHDLRTPLTRLRLGIELLGDKVETALSRGMIHDIEDMDSILMQFLDYARDGSEEVPQFADFNQIVFDVCHRYRVSGNPIRTQLDEFPGFRFRKLAMRRMIANLIDNAVRHGGRDVEVQTRSQPHAITLQVLDRGPGLRHLQPGEVLQPFVRADRARGQHAGSGLGLTIAERVARMHGGVLNLANREDGGLQVTVSLPVAVFGP
ncbi:MAG: ATP-binding protein [Gammaproteobacteria bacterium]